MKSLSTEHTLIAALPILIVLAVLSAAIIVFPKVNLDDRSRATQPKSTDINKASGSPLTLPQTTEPTSPSTNPLTPYQFPATLE
jgi:hypothetical protein